MNETRHFDPGLGTLAVHFMVIALVIILMTPLTLARLILAPLTEGLIRLTDYLHDLIAERMER